MQRKTLICFKQTEQFYETVIASSAFVQNTCIKVKSSCDVLVVFLACQDDVMVW